MDDVANGHGLHTAMVGARLRQLLADHPRYRRRWQQASRRPTPGDLISVAAVSRVVVEHLWDSGQRPETTSDRAVRDRVRRALNGQLCSPETLGWLLEAFQMTDAEERELSGLLRRDLKPRGASGHLRRGTLPAVQHRTRSLNEFHVLGADRLPTRHHTVQVIEALVADYEVYPYRFDTPCARVTVIQGGVAGPVYPMAEGIWAVDITLTRPLQTGETTSVVYDTRFAYDEPPAPEFRRAALTRVDSVNLKVTFDRAALPAAVWWAQWDLGSEPVDEHLVDLDAQHSVERFLPLLDSSIVGFRWEWPPA